MTISISAADYWECARQIPPPPGCTQDLAESFWAMPALNTGYAHYIELGAGIELSLWQETYFEDTEILCPTRSHPWIELTVLVTGSYRLDTGRMLKAGQSQLQGSGIAAGDRELYAQDKFCRGLN
jgi:hypothetical protein